MHSRGPVPKWQKNQELLKVFGVRNRAGQTYFPKDKRVENYGEVVGGLVRRGVLSSSVNTPSTRRIDRRGDTIDATPPRR